MSAFPQRTCTVCGRRGIGASGRCELHPPPARILTQPYRRGYATGEHRRNRRLCLERAGGICAICGGPLGEQPNVDHIVPLRDGGGNEPGNLQATCPRCNQLKKRIDARRRRLS